MSEETKLELVRELPAETEKKIVACCLKIRVALNGHGRSRSLMRVWALVAGHQANLVMDMAPHGAGEARLRVEFGGVSRSNLHVWRTAARKFADRPKCPILDIWDSPRFKNHPPSPKKLAVLDASIDGVIGRQSLSDFARDRPPKETKGGFCFDHDKFTQWMADNHPERNGATYEDLPPTIRREFNRWWALQKHEPPLLEKADDEAGVVAKALETFMGSQKAAAYSDAALDVIDALCKKAREKIKTLRGKETGDHPETVSQPWRSA